MCKRNHFDGLTKMINDHKLARKGTDVKMKIIVDGFGGDNAPLSVLQGCALAVAEYDDVEIIVTGEETKIRKVAAENNISLHKILRMNRPIF